MRYLIMILFSEFVILWQNKIEYYKTESESSIKTFG